MIGPFFIDWTAYRAQFEREASRIFGAPFEVRGPADVTILPLPRMTFDNVLIDMRNGTQLQIGRVYARLELLPLLQGDYHFVDLVLDRPNLVVTLDPNGQLPERPLLRGSFSTGAESQSLEVSVDEPIEREYFFENIDVFSGRVTILDPRRDDPFVLNDVSFRGNGRSLLGPFRGDVGFLYKQQAWDIDVATGEYSDSGIRLQVGLSDEASLLGLAVDGFVRNSRNGPLYEGTFRFQPKDNSQKDNAGAEQSVETQNIPQNGFLAWDAAGDFTLSGRDLRFKKLSLRRGAEESPLTLTGVATVDFSRTPSFNAVVSARQIDLDRSLGGGPDDPVNVGAVLDQFINLNAALPHFPLPGQLGFELGSLVAGGNIIRDIRVDAKTRNGGWIIENAEALLPGGTNLALDGVFGSAGKPEFEGFIDFYSETPSTLFPWLSGKPLDPRQPRLKGFGIRGELDLKENSGSLEDLTVFFEDGSADGRSNWSFEDGSRLSASLQGSTLDVDVLRGLVGFLSDGSAENGIRQLELELTVDEMTGEGLVARDVDLKIENSPDELRIDRLSIEDIEGAKIAAAGNFSALGLDPEGALRASIEAQDAVPLVEAALRIWPNQPLLQYIDSIAPALSPMALVVRARANETNTIADSSLSLNGTAGESDISVEVSLGAKPKDWRTAPLAADVRLSNEKSQTLLNQFGIPSIAVSDLGPGALFLRVDGNASDTLKYEWDSNIAGIAGVASGNITLNGSDYSGALSLSLNSENANPFLMAIGANITELDDEIPVQLSMDLTGETGAFETTRFEGSLLGSEFSGTLNGVRNINILSIEGDLDADLVDVNRLGAVVMGAQAFNVSSIDLPDLTFAEPFVSGFDANVHVNAKTLYVNEMISLGDASFVLGFGPRELALDTISGTFEDRAFNGNVRMRLNDLTANFSANGSIRDLDLQRFSWVMDDAPLISGALTMRFDTEGSGRTLQAVARSLSGSGTFSVNDLTITHLDTGAISRLVRQADDDELELDAAVLTAAIEGELNDGKLSAEETQGLFSIADGVLRARNIDIRNEPIHLKGGGTIDLFGESLESNWSLVTNEEFPEPKVAGAVPEIGLYFDGETSAPVRAIDVDGLLAYLSLRSFERESRRIEVLQSDILERERLNRDLNRIRYEEARKRIAAEQEAAAQAAEAQEENAEPDNAGDAVISN